MLGPTPPSPAWAVEAANSPNTTVVQHAVFMIVIVAGFVHRISLPRVMTDAEMKANGAYMFETPRKIGEFKGRILGSR